MRHPPTTKCIAKYDGVSHNICENHALVVAVLLVKLSPAQQSQMELRRRAFDRMGSAFEHAQYK